MSSADEIHDDADVPAQALQALAEANARARAAGRTVVLVRDDRLIRLSPDGSFEILKELPPRPIIGDGRNTVGT